MDNICGNLEREDPKLQFYFLREPLQDGSGLYTCIARNLARNTLDFSCPDLESSLDSLRRGWAQLQAGREHIAGIGAYSLNYVDPSKYGDLSDPGVVSLREDVEQLAVSLEYRGNCLRYSPTTTLIWSSRLLWCVPLLCSCSSYWHPGPVERSL